MQIEREDILKKGTEVISVSEYLAQYGNGIKAQSLYYAIDNDLIDYVTFGGREKYIVMTEKTKTYKPNENKNRRTTTMQL